MSAVPQPQYERWQSSRTGGYRCEICFYDLGKPDEYVVIETRRLQVSAIQMLYGAGEPDAVTILCCVCERIFRADSQQPSVP
jgi:hypothetical protein